MSQVVSSRLKGGNFETINVEDFLQKPISWLRNDFSLSLCMMPGARIGVFLELSKFV